MEVLPVSHANGNSNGVHAEPQMTDPILVLEHIARLIEINLGAARRELEAVGNLLSQANREQSLDRCNRFATEPQVALFAQKDLRQDEVNGHDDGDDARRKCIPDGRTKLLTERRTRNFTHILPELRICLQIDNRGIDSLPQASSSSR